MSDIFHRLTPESDIKEGDLHSTIIEEWPVLVTRFGGKLFALVNKCSHASSELSGGHIRRGMIMCPLHGARFDLASGQCVSGTYRPLKTFECRIQDGWIEVAIPAEKPGPEHQPACLR
jgi:3-phenylpropionate/trans-cinnamate dioxygenase ferredoxin subunit